MTCDNIDDAIGPLYPPVQRPPRDQVQGTKRGDKGGPGWIKVFLFQYLLPICGEDCATRYAAGKASWEMLEMQAEENLRHSYAVVGLLEEIDDFYSMIDARVKYMNPLVDKNLISVVVDGAAKHVSGETEESIRCKQRFKDPSFQKELLERSPELRSILHLYEVGKKVKREQMAELKQCSPASFASVG